MIGHPGIFSNRGLTDYPHPPDLIGLRSGLVSWYSFEDAANLGLDSLGVNNLVNANVTQAAGLSALMGFAASFPGAGNGSLDGINTPTMQMAGDDFSVAGWYNTSNGGASIVLASKYTTVGNQREWRVNRSSTGGFSVSLSTTGANDITNANGLAGSINAGVWAHWAVTLKASGADRVCKRYINGVLLDTDTLVGAATLFSGTATFAVGSRNSGGASNAQGLLDGMGFWRGVILSQQQVTLLYNGGVGRQYPFT